MDGAPSPLARIQSLVSAGEYETARAELRAILDFLDPGNVDAQFLLARVEYLDGNIPAAVSLLEDLLTRRPDHERAQAALDVLRRPGGPPPPPPRPTPQPTQPVFPPPPARGQPPPVERSWLRKDQPPPPLLPRWKLPYAAGLVVALTVSLLAAMLIGPLLFHWWQSLQQAMQAPSTASIQMALARSVMLLAGALPASACFFWAAGLLAAVPDISPRKVLTTYATIVLYQVGAVVTMACLSCFGPVGWTLGGLIYAYALLVRPIDFVAVGMSVSPTRATVFVFLYLLLSTAAPLAAVWGLMHYGAVA